MLGALGSLVFQGAIRLCLSLTLVSWVGLKNSLFTCLLAFFLSCPVLVFDSLITGLMSFSLQMMFELLLWLLRQISVSISRSLMEMTI